MALPNRIYNYLKMIHNNNEDEWVSVGEIERQAMQTGYQGSTASRACRYLEENGYIRKRLNEKGHIEYQAL